MFILLQRISRRRAGFPQILLQEDFRHSPSTFAPYTRANIAELAREVIRSQTTLTGVQAKLSLDIAKEGKGTPERFTIVGLWGRYILKPQTEHYPHLPELEDLTMHMAEAVKMQVVPTRSSALPTGSCATSHAASTEGLTAKNIRWKTSVSSPND